GPFKWPVPSSSRISSPYGYRVILGNSEFHRGIDIPAGTGTPIVAANSGTVVAVTSSPGRGQYLIINHGGGLATLYQHCSAIYVSSGQTVQKGQKIAAVGNTGFSLGSHLHFEVRENGVCVNPVGYVRKP
ncbi:MAG: M23 family metallopeptidase, partial [Oscillospiraceae bacterium]